MRSDARPKPEVCNCLALRQASRHVTQFYDQLLASSGLRTTQFSILIRLKRAGPMTINALAKALVMDRTTLGRNILPLEREGLIDVVPGRADRRSKVLRLTKRGAAARGSRGLDASADKICGGVRRPARRRATCSAPRGHRDRSWCCAHRRRRLRRPRPKRPVTACRDP